MSYPRETVFFEKYDGTGNDFLVVDADLPVPSRAAFARAHCDRETGVTHKSADRNGADGVLFLALSEATSPPRVVMTLVQPDGSVAEMCGNGARCAGAWAASVSDADEFMLDTPAGTRRTTVHEDGVTVEMGRPCFEPESVPLEGAEPLVDEPIESLAATPAEGLHVTAVDTGVPHAVVFVDGVDDVDIEAVAPPIRHADCFPEGANVTFAARDGDGFRQRTYERGVEGETRACGTGAVAVVAAARRLGLVEETVDDAPGADVEGGRESEDGADWVRVSPPGGDLLVSVPVCGFAQLRGPAVKSFEGFLTADPRRSPEDSRDGLDGRTRSARRTRSSGGGGLVGDAPVDDSHGSAE
jgi:diaminopimelate epimerase